MAGVKISGMTDKSGGPDGTELVEVTSDPSGTPVTRRVTTQLIADLYELETHADTHENGGSDEIDVTGLSGVLADAQTPSAHASNHEYGGSDIINPGNMQGSTSGPSEKLKVSNTAITGSTDFFEVGFSDIEETATFTNTDDNRNAAVYKNYVVVFDADGTDELVVYNKNSMDEVNRVAATGGLITDTPSGVVVCTGSNNVYYSVPNLDVIKTISSSTAGRDAVTGESSNKLYALSGGSGNFLARYGLLGTYESGGTLTGLNTGVCALLLSVDENTAYIIDSPSAASGNVFFRIYDISTITAPSLTGSVSLGTTTNGELYSKLGFRDGFVVALVTGGGTNKAKQAKIIDVSTPSSPSVAYTSTSVLFANKPCFCDNGYIINPGYNFINFVQSPVETLKPPTHLDGSSIESSIFTHNNGYFSHNDWCDVVERVTYDRYDGYINFKRIGQFTVPSGSAFGSYTIEIQNILSDSAEIDEVADLIANVSLFVDREYTTPTPETAQSEHSGAVTNDLSFDTTWVDTLNPSNIPWLTAIEQIDATDGSLKFRVSWDTTTRAADMTVRYNITVKGPVWPMEYNPI